MADNYLEKRMEDLRNGRLNASSHAQKRVVSSPRAGCLSIPFPERRVLVAGDLDGVGESIATAFRTAGCKTALFHADKAVGERLAHDVGIRFYNTIINEKENVQKSLGNLLKAWHDIDIAICIIDDGDSGNEIINILCDTISKWRHNLPFPNPFGGRLILVSRKNFAEQGECTDVLLNHGFSTNRIVLHDSERLLLDSVARICLFLCAPGNEYVNGANIPICNASISQK